MSGADLTAHSNDPVRHSLGDLRIIDYASVFSPEYGYAPDFRLALPDLASRQSPHSDAVGMTALLESGETWQFFRSDSYDELSAAVMRNIFFSAKAIHRREAGAARSRLRRPRLVVKPGVDDAAVVPSLVRSEP